MKYIYLNPAINKDYVAKSASAVFHFEGVVFSNVKMKWDQVCISLKILALLIKW